MSDFDAASRRAVLGLTGSALLAGCGALPSPSPFGGEAETTLDGAAIRSVVAGDGPVVPERIPVEVGTERIEAGRARVRELLAVAPLPLDRSEIPNGAIRAELTDAAERAREDLDAAAAAPSPITALRHLRFARMRAGRVAGGWRYVDEGLRRGDLRDDADRLADDVAAFRAERSYAGAPDGAVRSVLVHATVGKLAGTAAGHATTGGGDRPGEWRSNPVSVGELVGDLERGGAALTDARHVYDRYVGSLDAARDLHARFAAAGADLLDLLADRSGDLPSSDASPAAVVDGLTENSPGGLALEGLLDDVGYRRSLTDPRDEGDVATVVVRAHGRLARVGGAEALVAALREGTRFRPASAADVRSLRKTTLAALEGAVRDAPHPDLAREAAADLAGRVRYADRELARVGDDTAADRLAMDLREYVRVRYVARALPEAGRAVADALRPEPEADGG